MMQFRKFGKTVGSSNPILNNILIQFKARLVKKKTLKVVMKEMVVISHWLSIKTWPEVI